MPHHASAGTSYAQRAYTIAEHVDGAWRARFAGSATIPISVVAALTLVSTADTDGPEPADLLMSATPDDIAQCIADIWIAFCRLRPDLMYRVLPLVEWTRTDDLYANQRDGAVAVARAAIKAGLLDLTVNGHVRDIDVLGPLLMTLRPKKARDGSGQFFTLHSLTRLMAEATLHGADLAPGMSFCEPAAGTGGMLLATAQTLRGRGHDPAAMSWAGVDVDPVIAACLAVNVHNWGLGADVLIGCGDGLLGDWMPRARHERALGIEVHQCASLHRLLAMLSEPPAGHGIAA